MQDYYSRNVPVYGVVGVNQRWCQGCAGSSVDHRAGSRIARIMWGLREWMSVGYDVHSASIYRHLLVWLFIEFQT